MNRPDLSVCMIVRNEAHQLEAALRNFRLFADEIVVVDTGSADGTRAVAERYADVVADYPWQDDFSAARNASLARARGRYFLWLDADDRVDDENVKKIIQLKSSFDGKRAYMFVLQDIRNGKPFVSLLQIRCAPNVPEVRFKGVVHERLDHTLEALGLPLCHTDIVIEHHGYTNACTLKKKIRRNLRLIEKMEDDAQGSLEDETMHYYRATSYHILGYFEHALKSMEKCLDGMKRKRLAGHEDIQKALDPFIWDAMLFCAETHLDQNRPHQSRRYLLQVEAFPDLHPYVLFRMGRLAQRMSRHKDALGYFRRVDLTRQTVTRLPWPHVDLSILRGHQAYSLYFLGGMEACAHLVASLPDEAMRGKAWECVGTLAVDNEEWSLASRAFHRDWSGYPLSLAGWIQYGTLLKREGQLSQAVKAFQKVLAEDPYNVGAAVKLANLYWQMGSEKKALELFETLVRNGVDDPPILKACEILRARVGEPE